MVVSALEEIQQGYLIMCKTGGVSYNLERRGGLGRKPVPRPLQASMGLGCVLSGWKMGESFAWRRKGSCHMIYVLKGCLAGVWRGLHKRLLWWSRQKVVVLLWMRAATG